MFSPSVWWVGSTHFRVGEPTRTMTPVACPIAAVAQRINLYVRQMWSKNDPGTRARRPAHNRFDVMIENCELHFFAAPQAAGPGYARAAAVDVKNLTVLLS